MSKKHDSFIKHLSQVIDEILDHLKNTGLTDSTINCYRCVYRKLLQFLDGTKKSTSPLTQHDLNAFLKHCGIPLNSLRKRNCKSKYYRKPLRILLEFYLNGSFNQFPKRVPRLLPDIFEAILVEYSQYRVNETGIKSPQKVLQWPREFLGFLCDRKVKHFENIRFDDVQAYFKSNPRLSPGTMRLKRWGLRGFFRYLILKELDSPNILDFIPRIRASCPLRLNAVWPKESVEKFLSVIDRNTNLGKRDYAICLLIVRLGLRTCDVRSMQLENLDWRKSVIRLSQQKTGNTLELPISEEIGIALIDYLKNGRPSSADRHVFLTHPAPYRPFARTATSRIVDKYRNKAGVILPKECYQGFHSLRHSLATRLHEAETPLPTIAAILGHSNVDSTRIYAKSNIRLLREAALGWKEEEER